MINLCQNSALETTSGVKFGGLHHPCKCSSSVLKLTYSAIEKESGQGEMSEDAEET